MLIRNLCSLRYYFTLFLLLVSPISMAQPRRGFDNSTIVSDAIWSLKLSLTATAVPNTTDTFTLRASLTNTGKKTYPIRGSWAYGRENDNFSAFFRRTLRLETEPVTYTSTRQTAMPPADYERFYEIKPGQTITAEWQTTCGCLKPDPTDEPAPCLVEPGRYKVTARFNGETTHTESYTSRFSVFGIRSAPVTVDFGGVTTAPNPTSARVIEVRPKEELATIDVGRSHGVEAGQVWQVIVSLGDQWDMEVVEVHENHSAVRLTHLYIIGPPPKPLKINSVAWRKDTMRYRCR